MDEIQFVKFLRERFPFAHGMGIGDDTTVVEFDNRRDSYQLITKDLFIQDVHFSLDHYSLKEVALKALAVNLSDIAAMGGVPLYFYLGLGFPARLGNEGLEAFFEGLEEGCKHWHVELAGGDFSSSATLVVSITMVGRVTNPSYRSTAQVGDLIGITGITGESAIGLQLMQKGVNDPKWLQKHKTVQPRIDAGRILDLYVNAMIDVSDGLLLDLKRILAASSKGARLDYQKLPVTDEMKHICRQHHLDLQQLVLSGGEDYQLLFTVSPHNETLLKQETLDYYIIGEINDQPEQLTVTDGEKTIDIDSHFGFDHFKPN